MKKFFVKIMYCIANFFYYMFHLYTIEDGQKLKKVKKAQRKLEAEYARLCIEDYTFENSKKIRKNLDLQTKLVHYKAELYGISQRLNLEDKDISIETVEEILSKN